VKRENERKVEDLANAIEGIGILKDEGSGVASPASTVRSMPTASFVQQAGEQLECSQNKRALDDGLPRMDPRGPVNLGAQLPDLGELGNYCAVVKTLLQDVEMVQDRIRAEYRRSFREGIIDSHTKNTQSLLSQHGHEKVSLAFRQSFADMLSQVSCGLIRNLSFRDEAEINHREIIFILIPRTTLVWHLDLLRLTSFPFLKFRPSRPTLLQVTRSIHAQGIK
jgi:hypothetical protein